MRKALLSLLVLVAFATPALAVPNDDTTGPEGVGSSGQSFFLITESVGNGASLTTSTIKETATDRFELADGWDFGDRSAYSCAWVEYFQGSNEKFELTYHAVSNYPGALQINDKFGDELEGPAGELASVKTLCWENDATIVVDSKGNTKATFLADGTDHFPHMIHPGDGLYFYQDGAPMLDPQGDPVFIDLQQPDCAKLYWVPGDDPGEVWLWWDEDGPTFSHGPGEGDLGCGGGPNEPVALIQLKPRHADSDVGYCVQAMDELTNCFNNEPPPTPVQLGSGKSVLTCPDSTAPAVETTEPLVVRCV